MFRLYQEKLTNQHQSLSTFSDPTMVSETDISESESDPSDLGYVPVPSRFRISKRRSELECDKSNDLYKSIVKGITGKDEN